MASMRSKDAPVIVLLDWDSEKKKADFQQPFKPEDPFYVLVWPQTAFNPKLGITFRGVERHMSDRLTNEADVAGIIATKPDGTRMVERKEYEGLKDRICGIVEKNLQREDLSFAEAFLKELAEIANPPAG